MTSNSILETHNLTVRFGGVQALSGVSLKARRGELTGLIGPNGAGKTTFIDSVTGFLNDFTKGQVLFDGTSVGKLSAHRRAHVGLSRTWQSLELFDDISVAENVALASRRLTFKGAVKEFWLGCRENPRVYEVLKQLELTDVAHRMPRELSLGQRKLVGVARALAAEAEFILMDEPAAGLDSNETLWLADRLRKIVADGMSILLVDHDMRLVLGACDYVHVLEFGKLIASGTPDEIRNNSKVASAYLGGTSDEQ
jgi:branched-chain amino acid transport system ATP-binding protein